VFRLIIVADITLYREGLAHILGRDARLTVVGTAADLDHALALVREQVAGVVLVDMAMPRSLETVRAVVATMPALRVVALGVPDHERDLLACAEAGVAGYVPREGSVAELIAVLESVARGELLCSPRAAAALLHRVAALAAAQGTTYDRVIAKLTAREREVARLLEAGSTNKEIAQRLGIEVATVKNHVHNLLEKLRVHRRGEAAARLRAPDELVAHRRPTPVP